MTTDEETAQRQVDAKTGASFVLALLGLISLTTGAGIAWGLGPALVILGAVVLVIGLLLGLVR